MSGNKINSSKAPEPVGLYQNAHRVGNLLFLSGVGLRQGGTKKNLGIELDEQGNIVLYNIGKQYHNVLKKIKSILKQASIGWANIVDVTVFLTNMKDDFKTDNKIYVEFFKDNLPCRTTVEINCLPTPIAIELKVIASLPNPSEGGA